MFDVLIASNAAAVAPRVWPARAASMLVHVGLVALAVQVTRSVHAAAPSRLTDTLVVWHSPAPVRPAPAPGGTPALTATADPTVPVLRIPDVIPPVSDLPPGPVTAPDVPFAPGPIVIGPPGPGPGRLPGVVITAHEADEAPRLLSHPPVEYPGVLRSAGIQGRAEVEVVLDTLGRAESASLRIVSASHPLFGESAANVVRASRYRPALVAGRPVRVRIRVPVEFVVQR